MLLKAWPCPKCGKSNYGLPYCRHCNWYDEKFDEWSQGHIKRLLELYQISEQVGVQTVSYPTTESHTEPGVTRKVSIKKDKDDG